MKKIISALALGAVAFGSAAAKTSVSLGYKNTGSLMHYNNRHLVASDGTDTSIYDVSTMNLFRIADAANTETLKLTASGDILDYTFILQPGFSAPAVKLKAIEIGAKVAALHVLGGFHADGHNNGFRLDSGTPWEGNIGNAYKPGSLFKNSFAQNADNYTNIANNDTRWFGEADFTISIANSDASVKLIGTWIGDQTFAQSNGDADKDDNIDYFNRTGWGTQIAASGSHDVVQKDAMGWIATVLASKPGLFKAQLGIKGIPYVAWNDKSNGGTTNATSENVDKNGINARNLTSGESREIGVFVPNFYFQLLAVKNLSVTAGAAVSIYDFNVSDYAFDVRALVTLLGGKLRVGYQWNLSIIDPEWFNSSFSAGTSAQQVAKPIGTVLSNSAGTAFATNRAMLNFLWAEFTLNPTFTAGLYIHALTDVGDGPRLSSQDAHGTALSVTPTLKISASKAAYVAVGFNFTVEGIGMEDNVGTAVGDNLGDSVNISFAIPVSFKVSM